MNFYVSFTELLG